MLNIAPPSNKCKSDIKDNDIELLFVLAKIKKMEVVGKQTQAHMLAGKQIRVAS